MHSAIDSISIQPLKFRVWSVLSITHSYCCVKSSNTKGNAKGLCQGFHLCVFAISQQLLKSFQINIQ